MAHVEVSDRRVRNVVAMIVVCPVIMSFRKTMTGKMLYANRHFLFVEIATTISTSSFAFMKESTGRHGTGRNSRSGCIHT